MTKAEKLPNGDIDTLVNAFFKNPNEYYSNGDILAVIDQVLAQIKNPSIKDYLSILDKGYVPPNISKADLDKFYQTKNVLQLP